MKIPNLKPSFLLLSIIFLSSIPLSAQILLDDTVRIEELVVTGSKITVARENIPYTISVLDQQEIEHSSESALLPVLTEQVPGLFITEKGITGFGVAGGAAGQITIRGIGGSPNTQVLVLLNGNPQYMGVFGHPLPDSYIASDVQRVEVIRGPASTLYGSNAMGGVINIITKEQKADGFNANARLMYGSYNTQKYMINSGYKKGKFNAFIGINHDQTNGHRDSSDFTITNGFISTGYKINKQLSAKVDFSLAGFEATDPGPESENAGFVIDIARGMGAVVVDNDFDITKGSVRFFYNFGEHKITDGFHSTDNNYGIVFYQSVNMFKGNTVTGGIDYKIYGGKAENTLAMNGNGMQFADTLMKELGTYVAVQQELWSKLTFNAGCRLENHSSTGNHWVPSAGLSYKITSRTTWKLSISKGFRNPTIRELYMWGTANDSLQPEQMIQYETSLSHYMLKNKLSIEAALFKADGDNLIQTINSRYQNTGSFSNIGVELAIKYKPADIIHLHANYSFIRMDEPILATPGQQFFISGTSHLKKWIFNISYQQIIDLYLQTGATEMKETYGLLNARIEYKMKKFVSVFVKGENLLDTGYEINYDYPMPRIIVYGGINIHL